MELSDIINTSQSPLGPKQGQVSLYASWRETESIGKSPARACWVAFRTCFKHRILWIEDPFIRGSLSFFTATSSACSRPPCSVSRHNFCQKITGWPTLNLSRWQVGTVTEVAFLVSVLNGCCRMKGWVVPESGVSVRAGGGEQRNGTRILWTFLTVSFLFLPYPLLRSVFFSSSLFSVPLCFCISFLTPRYRQRDPCGPSCEWEINPAVPEQERLHLFGHLAAKAIDFRSDPLHTRTGT